MTSVTTPRATVLVTVFLLCLFFPASGAAVWETETIAPSVPEPIAADIAGSHVVYSVAYGEAINVSTPRGLLLYEAATGTTTSLANASSPFTLTGGDTAGDAIVWFEEPQVFLNESVAERLTNRIMLHSLSTNITTSIRSSQSAEWPKTDGHRVVWSETPNDSYISTLSLYDIANKTTETLPVHTLDGSSVVLEGDTIAFQDGNTSTLTLYDIPSHRSTAVMVPVHTNVTSAMVESFAMGGDVLLYSTEIVEFSPKRSISNTLTWYSITEQTNVTLSPITGLPVGNLTTDERKAAFDSLFTDGETVGWVLETGISESDVITVNAKTGAVSHLKIDGDVAFPSVDSDQAVWVQSKLMADSHVVLATQDVTNPVSTQASAPVFGMLCAAGAFAAIWAGKRE